MTKPKKNALEWSVFLASAALVLTTLGYLIWSAAARDNRPPDVHIYTGTPILNARGDAWRVPIVVRNVGDKTAEAVAIEVTLEKEGKEVENATVDITFVPRHSEREAWATFRRDPRTCTVRTRAAGYAEP